MSQSNDLDYANKNKGVSKQDLVSALDSVSYDKNVVLEMMDKHPDMVKMLSEAKDKDGKPLFDALAIDDILINCKDTIEQHPDRIVAVLSDPKKIDIISLHEDNRGYPLWDFVQDAKKQSNTNEEQNITNRLVAVREKLSGKTDEKLGTNRSTVNSPKETKNVGAKILRQLGKSGR